MRRFWRLKWFLWIWLIFSTISGPSWKSTQKIHKASISWSKYAKSQIVNPKNFMESFPLGRFKPIQGNSIIYWLIIHNSVGNINYLMFSPRWNKLSNVYWKMPKWKWFSPRDFIGLFIGTYRDGSYTRIETRVFS